MTSEQLARLRALHVSEHHMRAPGYVETRGLCVGCREEWPCTTKLLLDALDAAQRERERLARALADVLDDKLDCTCPSDSCPLDIMAEHDVIHQPGEIKVANLRREIAQEKQRAEAAEATLADTPETVERVALAIYPSARDMMSWDAVIEWYPAAAEYWRDRARAALRALRAADSATVAPPTREEPTT